MKKVLFVILFAALLLCSACGTEESAPRKYTDWPKLYVTVGETLVYESKGINSWGVGGAWVVSGEPVSLEYRAEHMEYDTVSQAQAHCSFTLPPDNGMGVKCYQYIDGKLIEGETTLSEADGTLELLPGKWIYQITARWYSEVEDYVGSGTFTFGIDLR